MWLKLFVKKAKYSLLTFCSKYLCIVQSYFSNIIVFTFLNYSVGHKSRPTYLFWVAFHNTIGVFSRISIAYHKKLKVFSKLFILTDFVERFSLIILVQRHFQCPEEMPNFHSKYKIWYTSNVCNIVCFVNLYWLVLMIFPMKKNT